jgi:hypothetical protein
VAGFGLRQLADHACVIDVQESGTGGQHVSATGCGSRRAEVAGELEDLRQLELAVCAGTGAVQPPGQDIYPQQLVPGPVLARSLAEPAQQAIIVHAFPAESPTGRAPCGSGPVTAARIP